MKLCDVSFCLKTSSLSPKTDVIFSCCSVITDIVPSAETKDFFHRKVIFAPLWPLLVKVACLVPVYHVRNVQFKPVCCFITFACEKFSQKLHFFTPKPRPQQDFLLSSTLRAQRPSHTRSALLTWCCRWCACQRRCLLSPPFLNTRQLLAQSIIMLSKRRSSTNVLIKTSVCISYCVPTHSPFPTAWTMAISWAASSEPSQEDTAW